jgi:phospholipase/carboxylesterase
VLDALPEADLTGAKVLTIAGAHDPFGQRGPELETWLRRCGATIDTHMIDAGHQLVPADRAIAGEWLSKQPALAG